MAEEILNDYLHVEISRIVMSFFPRYNSGTKIRIKYGLPMCYKNDNADYVLEFAALYNVIWIIEDLIKNNVSLNFNRMLRGACQGGHKELAEWAVSKGADAFNDAFGCARWKGHEDMAEWIVSKGADDFNYALGCICWKGCKDMEDRVVSRGFVNFDNIDDFDFERNCSYCGGPKDIGLSLLKGANRRNHALNFVCYGEHNI